MNDAIIFNLPEGGHGDLFTKHNCHANIKSYLIEDTGYLFFPWLMVPHKHITRILFSMLEAF
jgi:hypothetical protein